MNADYHTLVMVWIGLAVLLIPLQCFVKAPYGRHRTAGWGPGISNALGWVIMESVALISFLVGLGRGNLDFDMVTMIFSGLFITHYLNRSIIYPLQIRTHGKLIPVLIVGFAVIFNSINGFINGYFFSVIHTGYEPGYLTSTRCLAGLALFFTGAVINIWSDQRLIHLRKANTNGDYVIPRGGIFRWISCPNHLGEILEWSGFALMVWSLPALSFAIWTIANLVPRAVHHHRWYRRTFPDYPGARKALVPFFL